MVVNDAIFETMIRAITLKLLRNRPGSANTDVPDAIMAFYFVCMKLGIRAADNMRNEMREFSLPPEWFPVWGIKMSRHYWKDMSSLQKAKWITAEAFTKYRDKPWPLRSRLKYWWLRKTWSQEGQDRLRAMAWLKIVDKSEKWGQLRPKRSIEDSDLKTLAGLEYAINGTGEINWNDSTSWLGLIWDVRQKLAPEATPDVRPMGSSKP